MKDKEYKKFGMKNQTPMNSTSIFWVLVVVFAILLYFLDFNVAIFIIISTALLLAISNYRTNKSFFASVRNLMIAKARLLNVISIAERVGDDKGGEQDHAEHLKIICENCTYGLDSDMGVWPLELKIEAFLIKEFKKLDFEEIFWAPSSGKSYEEFYLDEIKAIKNEFKDENSTEYFGYKDSVLRGMAQLLVVDGEVTNFEREVYIKIAKGLGFSEVYAETSLTVRLDSSKQSILETLKIIPDLSKKQIDYIDSEYKDLKELHDMSEEDIRDNLPGITKAVARAIKKKLDDAFK